MTDTAIILVTDPQRSQQDHVGLPLLKRTVLSAQRGGVEKFIIVAEDYGKGLRALLSGDHRIHAPIYWADLDTLPEQFNGLRSQSILIIRAEAFFDSGLIKKFTRLGLDGAVAYVAVRKGAGQCGIRLNGDDVVDCSIQPLHQTHSGQDSDGNPTPRTFQTAGIILTKSSVADGLFSEDIDVRNGLHKIVRCLLNMGRVKAVNVTDKLCIEITSQQAARQAKAQMYEHLGLSTDSPFAVHVNRKLSRLVSNVLIRLPITPNQITLLSFFVGLVACWFFLGGGYWYSILGVLTFYASIILDLADGEVARLKFMYSRYGALLDSVCDSIVHSGIILCIALAIHREAHVPNILIVGLIAAGAMFICSHLDFYLHFMEKDLSKGQPGPLTRLFANEDYFYLSLLGFTVFDGLTWYLWAVAAGSVVYALVLSGKLILIQFTAKEVAT